MVLYVRDSGGELVVIYIKQGFAAEGNDRRLIWRV